MPRYKKADTNQYQMMVLNYQEMFSESHPVSQFLKMIQKLDLSKFHENYRNEETGAEAIPPDRMLACMFWHLLHGGVSQRQLERDLLVRADLMYLSGGLTIDHSTISRFISRHDAVIHELLHQTIIVGVEAGLVRFEEVAIDSTVMKGNASKFKHGTLPQWIKRKESLLSKIDWMYEKWKSSKEEDEKLLWEQKLEESKSLEEKISKAIEHLKDHPEQARYNLTDPDADWHGKPKSGIHVGYNAHLAVDGESGMIVHQNVYQEKEASVTVDMVRDTDEVQKAVLENEESTKYLLDSGYAGESNLEQLEGFDLYMPDRMINQQKEKKEKLAPLPHLPTFYYDRNKNEFTCMEGKTLKYCSTSTLRRDQYYTYRKAGCESCPSSEKCHLKSKNRATRIISVRADLLPELKFYQPSRKGKSADISKNHVKTHQMREKLKTEEGKKIYSRRSPIVERANSLIKEVRKKSSFLRRGLEKVRTEWSISCIAHNLSVINGFRQIDMVYHNQFS